MIGNGPEITKAIRLVLGDSYNYDSTVRCFIATFPASSLTINIIQPTFYALYRSFTECIFVEEVGDILFYKNKDGVAQRKVADFVLERIRENGYCPKDQDQDQSIGDKNTLHI